MPESPYQSMIENEHLFQQEPWSHRVPYQVAHALRPVRDAAVGAGLGGAVGGLLGKPNLGMALGGALGTAYGVMSHQPTASQHWAFNNPEKIHMLRSRQAFDYAQPGITDLAYAQEMGKQAALERYGLGEKRAGFGGAAMGAMATGLPMGVIGAIHGGIEGALNAEDGDRVRSALYGAASRGAATGLVAAVPGAIGGHIAGNAAHLGVKALAKQLIQRMRGHQGPQDHAGPPPGYYHQDPSDHR